MTNYGTIPTSSSPAANLEFISRAKDRLKAGFSTRRPWRLMVTPLRSLCLPSGLADALIRARVNTTFFRVNYAVSALVILFLALLWHPISLIVLTAMVFLWIFLYFLRDEPLVVFNRTIDDRVVLAVLAALTVGLLLLTGATLNVLVAVLVAAVLIVVHAVLRRTEDLFVDEESAGLMTGVGAGSSSS